MTIDFLTITLKNNTLTMKKSKRPWKFKACNFEYTSVKKFQNSLIIYQELYYLISITLVE